MKVKDIPYVRISLSELQQELEAIAAGIRTAADADSILSLRERMLRLLARYQSASTLCKIRHNANTADPFYLREHEYYDEIDPEVQNLFAACRGALLRSPFRDELEIRLSPLYFRWMEVQAKTISPLILDDMIEENRLCSEYSLLMSGLEIVFRGKRYTVSELYHFLDHDNRAVRREAYIAYGTHLNTIASQLDDIFDRLVKVRHRMAQKIGYENFVPLGYARVDRISYGKDEVGIFRRNVLDSIVPVVSRLRREAAGEIGVNSIMVYDNGILLSGGDPKPLGGENDILRTAREMYHEMSAETGRFIDMMLGNEAFDLDVRKNKWSGGCCAYIPSCKQPFIFANFNGTADDVEVMTHEAGHALNACLIADNRFALEIGSGGAETAETQATAMEFFAWRYTEKFFGKDAARYQFTHALDIFSRIPFAAAADAFQQAVYEDPEMSPQQRNALWAQMEAEYRPYLSNDGIPFFEDGRRWQLQMHIYELPFYFIDYALAQTAALWFLMESQKNYQDAFDRYLTLMKHGGEVYFEDLLKEARIPSPFREGSLQAIAAELEALLHRIRQTIS